MGFLIKLILVVAALFGLLHLFFRDSAFYAEIFPEKAAVHGGARVEAIALRTIYRLRKKDGTRTFHNSDVADFYRQAVDRKFESAAGGKDFLPGDAYFRLEKDATARSWLLRNDRNDDKRVDRNEWQDSVFAFSRIDKNKDNFLSGDEYWGSVSRDTKRWFASADSNSDGQLSRDEFTAKHHEDDAAEKFASQLDTNSNSILDSQEFEEAAFTWGLRR